MSRHETTRKANPPRRCRRGRRIVAVAVLLLLVAPPLWFGRTPLAWWTRMMARARIHDGAISTAQGWLDWSAWFDPRDGATDVLRGACFRRLQQQDRWAAALTLAEQKGAPASQVQRETRLGRIQGGDLEEGDRELAAMTASGEMPDDFCEALVTGCLVKKDATRAKRVLDAWEARHPDDAQWAYAEGRYWLWMSEVERDIVRRQGFLERTHRAFEKALARQPRHELARIALAELFEDQSRLEEALQHCTALVTEAPASEAAQLKRARLLRALHRLGEARTVLASLPREPQAAVEFAAEMAEFELESGNYQEADRWFARAGVDLPGRNGRLIPAAVAAAFQERSTRARQLFARNDAYHNHRVRMDDLVARLTIGADDPQAEAEARRLAAVSPGAGPAAEDGPEDAEATPSGLYALHCSGCHGENGDGQGRATRHLFPKPRDLRTGRSRLVSTVNGVPSLEDLEAVIRRGMPGTSMRAFDQLDEDQRMLLAQEVRRLNRVGIGEHYIDMLVKQGEKVDEHEVREVVKRGTTPADPAGVPRIGPADPQAIARGREAYVKLGCYNCHGADGTGAGDLPLFDEKGRPVPPRNLVHEPCKGGPEPEALYLRLLLGMPGTPHPACPSVASDQLIDLVHYCRSLFREPKQAWSNHQRALQAWTLLPRIGG